MNSLLEKAISLANSDSPLLPDDYCLIEQDISREFRWYLIGLTCCFALNKSFKSDKLNKYLTSEQISRNSGYAENSLKQLARYTKAITKLQRSLPDLAGTILTGTTRLGLKTTIALARLPVKDTIEIVKRINMENTPVRRIIEEHLNRPMYKPRGFSDGQCAGYSQKSDCLHLRFLRLTSRRATMTSF